MLFGRLRDLREDRDLLQTDVAKVLGISRSTAHHRLQKALQLLRIDFDEGRDAHD